ncbi:MAG: hypothetical protein S4CHLAM6_00160 [Chlamydiae bacterium]|nr:hypothetical protein [Chlamydiota bacterium]
MPAIGNYTGSTNLTVEYQFGGSRTHHLNYYNHIVHQACTLWEKSLYLQVSIAAISVIDAGFGSPLFDSLKQGTFTSYPSRLLNSNPAKYLILSIINSLSYVSVCTAKNIYSRRSDAYQADFHLALKKDQEHCENSAFNQLLVNNEKLLPMNSRSMSNILPHFFRVPDHTFVFSPCKDQFQKLLQNIQNSPQFQDILLLKNSTDVQHRLGKLIHGYTEPLFADSKLHGEL